MEMDLNALPHGQFAPDNPPDRDARLQALDPTGSFAVAAPAGSGKTGLLTQRVLTLLARCDEPEEVLAITFTRKAAGEMQERIMIALHEAVEQPEPEDPHKRRTWQLTQAVLKRDAERHWQLLLSPQRLRIQTIDSLCRAITRQLPLDSLLGAQPDTLDNAESAYRQAVHNLFALLEQDDPVRDDLKVLLRHLDTHLPATEALLMRLLAKREQWLDLMIAARQEGVRQYLEDVLAETVCEHLENLTDAIGHHASDLCLLADQAAANLAESAPDNSIVRLLGASDLPPAIPDALPDWLSFADLLLTTQGEWRKAVNKNQGFPAGKEGAALKARFTELVALLAEDVPDLHTQLHTVRLLPPTRYSDSQWQLLESLTRLLPLLVAQLTVVFQQLGATDFSAITHAANTALGEEDEPTDIALKLDYRIRHILVDEFQDTASPQLQLLEKLTAGWQPDDGRTLFIVGDGMQSCYGFRDANVGLFLDARSHGIGQVPLTPVDLQVNFRSQSGVVRWVNQVFQAAFPSRDDIGRGAVSYAPSIAFKAPLDGEAVRVHICSYQSEPQSESQAESDDADAQAVYPDASPDRLIAQWREAESVALLAGQALAENPQDSVAILVRGRNHLADILPALQRQGLHPQATEIDPLSSRMAIVDLMSLTRALLNLDDRIAWLSILRAPWCGLDLHDLHRLATTDLGELSPRPQNGWPIIWQQLRHREQIDGLSDNGQQCLARLMRVLVPAWQTRQRKPLRQWLEGIWLALGGPATLTDPADRDNLPAYFALLESHQWGGSLRDWDSFQQAVARLYAAPRADADPRLQVMTLHKSKGLEFDTVIIPGLDRKSANNDRELLLWQQRVNHHGERQLLLGPLAPTGQDTDPLYQFMRNEAKLRDGYEATRLLYVGCTRAIKRLHLLACINVDAKKGELKAPSQGLINSIWPWVKDTLQTAPTPATTSWVTAPAQADGRPGQQHILRLPVDWQRPLLPDNTLLKSYRGREFDDEDNLPEPETRQARLARHIGTVLHAQLQYLAEQTDLPEWSPEWQETHTPFWRVQLRQLGWEGEELAQGVEKIQRGLALTLTDPQGRWLLDSRHDHSRCELAIQHREGPHLRESVIDRTFVHDGIRWIVDYKSSTPDSGQTSAQFIETERILYQPQLQRYCRALQALGETRLRAALYFPRLESGERLVVLSELDTLSGLQV